MQQCERCNVDFYSDTEFREHRLMEDLQEMAYSNALPFRNFEVTLNMLCIQLIMQRDGIPFDAAATQFFEGRILYNKAAEVFNKKMAEQMNK